MERTNNTEEKKKKKSVEIILKILIQLFVFSGNKLAIATFVGMETLARFLHQWPNTIISLSYSLMFTLSSVVDSIQRPDVLATDLIKLLHEGNAENVVYAAGIISSLTSKENFSLALFNQNGLQELSQTVKAQKRNPILLEHIFNGLHNLTKGHREEAIAQHIFIYELSGLSMIKKWTRYDYQPPCLKAALQLILNLASKPIYHKILSEEGLIHHLLSLLSRNLKNIMATDCKKVNNRAAYEEVVMLCLVFISHFSEEPLILSNNEVCAILCQMKHLLQYKSENIQNLTLKIISGISQDLNGAYNIMKAGLSEPLSAHFEASNESSAKNCSMIMHNLEEVKRTLEVGTFRPKRFILLQFASWMAKTSESLIVLLASIVNYPPQDYFQL